MSIGSNRFIRVLAIVLVLSGCASTPQHLSEKDKNAIKNVTIVSLVPESVSFDKIGIISFANRYTEFDMGGLVTGNILSVSRQRIEKTNPGWNIKSVEYDRTALLNGLKPGLGFRSTRIQEALAGLAHDNDLDAIFVVWASADDENYLHKGLNVLLMDNNLDRSARLVFRANLSVTIVGKNGEELAAGTIPAKLEYVDTQEPDNFDVRSDMKHNQRSEVLDKLRGEVIVDLTRRLNQSFDILGFSGGFASGEQHANIVPQPGAVIDSTAKSPGQDVPATDPFDQCFTRCRQYTDRTKEQCFDACNK